MLETREQSKQRDLEVSQKAAQRDQLTFTIVEQDSSAVKTVAHWLYENIETAPEVKLLAALSFCIEARKYYFKKKAD